MGPNRPINRVLTINPLNSRFKRLLVRTLRPPFRHRRVPTHSTLRTRRRQRQARRSRQPPQRVQYHTTGLANVTTNKGTPINRSHRGRVVISVQDTTGRYNGQLIVLRRPQVPAHRSHQGAHYHASLHMLRGGAQLQQRSLNSINNNRIPTPTMITSQPMLRRPRLLTIPNPFSITKRMVGRPRCTLRGTPWHIHHRTVKEFRYITTPQFARAEGSHSLKTSIPINRQLRVAFGPLRFGQRVPGGDSPKRL